VSGFSGRSIQKTNFQVKCEEAQPQPENWDICPPRFSLAPKITLDMRPIWLRPTAAMALASMPRYQVDELIEKRLVKVAYLFNQRGRAMPLIYGPSLWAYLEALAAGSAPEPSQPSKRKARKEVA
jgi:hypothetical protein